MHFKNNVYSKQGEWKYNNNNKFPFVIKYSSYFVLCLVLKCLIYIISFYLHKHPITTPLLRKMKVYVTFRLCNVKALSDRAGGHIFFNVHICFPLEYKLHEIIIPFLLCPLLWLRVQNNAWHEFTIKKHSESGFCHPAYLDRAKPCYFCSAQPRKMWQPVFLVKTIKYSYCLQQIEARDKTLNQDELSGLTQTTREAVSISS